MTNLSSDVEAAWLTKIWTNATITAITDRIFQYAITQDSEKELARLSFDEYIRFVEALTHRSVQKANTGLTNYTFTVEVNYYVWKDPDGDNWTAVRDFFETLYTLVVSQLGNSWQSTVDFWRPQDGGFSISEFTLDNEVVWKGSYSFTGFKIA